MGFPDFNDQTPWKVVKPRQISGWNHQQNFSLEKTRLLRQLEMDGHGVSWLRISGNIFLPEKVGQPLGKTNWRAASTGCGWVDETSKQKKTAQQNCKQSLLQQYTLNMAAKNVWKTMSRWQYINCMDIGILICFSVFMTSSMVYGDPLKFLSSGIHHHFSHYLRGMIFGDFLQAPFKQANPGWGRFNIPTETIQLLIKNKPWGGATFDMFLFGFWKQTSKTWGGWYPFGG